MLSIDKKLVYEFLYCFAIDFSSCLIFSSDFYLMFFYLGCCWVHSFRYIS